MPRRCKARTKSGSRCKLNARSGSYKCRIHGKSELIPGRTGVFSGIGALAGHAALRTVGGGVVGAGIGLALSVFMEEDDAMPKKIFVSYDFDNDKKLKDFIIGQSRNADSPFSVIDHSLKEAAPERSWEAKAEAAIKRSDIVLVMVGPQTYRAPGVLKEIAMARRNRVPIVQVIGYKDGNYKAVPGAGQQYRWNWTNLKKLLG